MLWTADSVEYRSVPMYAAYSGDTLIWLKDSDMGDYLTLEFVSGGTLLLDFSGKTTEMSVNKGDFQTVGRRTFNARAGDVVAFRGSDVQFNDHYADNPPGSHPNRGFRGGTAKFRVRGNLLSLRYPNSFLGRDYPTDNTANTYAFLFEDCNGLIDASGLVLPRTTGPNCYDNMFRGCTSLTSVPVLPATALTEGCYAAMFRGCTSLTTTPALPAKELASMCYYSMFGLCTSLRTAPALPATTLAELCYTDMFHDCTALTTPPVLPATKLAEGCYSYMFQNCTSLTTAPVLSVEYPSIGAYQAMFSGCTSLNYIKCLAKVAQYRATNWVKGVSPTGTFVKNQSMNDWTTGNSGIPPGWTVLDG